MGRAEYAIERSLSRNLRTSCDFPEVLVLRHGNSPTCGRGGLEWRGGSFAVSGDGTL